MTASVEEKKSVLSKMDGSGDSKFMWSADNQDEIDAAEKMFTELKAKGYLAYKVDANGDKAEVIHQFDETAEKIIMSPQIIGG